MDVAVIITIITQQSLAAGHQQFNISSNSNRSVAVAALTGCVLVAKAKRRSRHQCTVVVISISSACVAKGCKQET
jgi:hypothetical protein